jgi:hypothetical protein
MPQALKADIKYNNLSIPVSYRTTNTKFLNDSLNVFTNQNRIDTRFGVQRFSTYALNGLGFILDVSLLDENYLDDGTIADESLLENVTSISFFKKTDGTKYYICKAGTVLWALSTTGQHTVLKTGLSSSTKHRSVSFNNRCFIAIESDGLYSFDGTTFTQLGQDPPTSAVTLGASGAGATLPTASYQVAFTYYASGIGFETNIGTASASQAITLGQQLDVTSISTTTPDNALIDKKRIYIKNVTTNGEWLFWSEIDLSDSTETINLAITSTQNPPETNASPLDGGGKFLDVFGKKLVYSGSATYPNDVFFSEEYIPDAFDDATESRLVFKASGDGAITGIKTGYFNLDKMIPFLCVFKRRSIEIYSDFEGTPQITKINNIGCVATDTIKEINGNVYFMSEAGFHIISNGKIVEKDNNYFKLGDGEIDAIFTDEGFGYQLNLAEADDFFSVYFSPLKSYMNFIAESGTTLFTKSYNYELEINGFRPFLYPINYYCACEAENSDNETCILIGGKNGRVYSYCQSNTKTDYDTSNTATDIRAMIQLPWIAHDDFDATMNFGTLILKAITSSTALSLRYFLNYDTSQRYNASYSVSSVGGFVLDESYLDVDYLGDNRAIVRQVGSGVYKTAQSLSIQIEQTGQNLNLGLISLQVSASKNGNPN